MKRSGKTERQTFINFCVCQDRLIIVSALPAFRSDDLLFMMTDFSLSFPFKFALAKPTATPRTEIHLASARCTDSTEAAIT